MVYPCSVVEIILNALFPITNLVESCQVNLENFYFADSAEAAYKILGITDDGNPNLSIDLILMDIRIPGMNGYDATREIRKSSKKIPIIAQTAYAMQEDRKKCIEAGCNDYFAKPIEATEFIEFLSPYLE